VLTGRGMLSAAVPEEELDEMAASVDQLAIRIEEVAERLERA
jgi:hypothetical protein